MATKEEIHCIRKIQNNIGKNRIAMLELRKYYTKYKMDIACIQEPIIKYSKLVNMSATSTSIFHSKDSVAVMVVIIVVIIILQNIA